MTTDQMDIKEEAGRFFHPEGDLTSRTYYERLVESMEQIKQAGRTAERNEIISKLKERIENYDSDPDTLFDRGLKSGIEEIIELLENIEKQ